MNITIDGKKIKSPTDFTPNDYKITKARRLTSGDMAMEYITKKRSFDLSYEVLSGPEYENIRSIFMSPESFYTMRYDWNGRREMAVVYVGAIKANKFRTDGIWYWTDCSFSLIER